MKKIHFFLATAITSLSLGVGLRIDTFATGSAKIQIMPTSQKIEVKPGDVYTGTFSIQNIGDTSFRYRTVALPYQVNGEGYSPDFSVKNQYTQIADWITFDIKENILDSGFYDKVTYTINIPKNATAGGQYASLMAYVVDNEKDSSIQTVGRVGLILYVTVEGETNKEGYISETGINTISFSPPISSWVLLQNTGNVSIDAKVSLKANSFFTNSTLYENNIDITVLPGTTRRQYLSWDTPPRLGVFRISQTVDFGDQNSTVEKIVLICPLWLIILVIIILVLSVILITLKFSHKQNSNKKLANLKHKR